MVSSIVATYSRSRQQRARGSESSGRKPPWLVWVDGRARSFLWNIVPNRTRPARVGKETSLMANRIDLCSIADIAPGNALKVEAGELTLSVFNVDGEFYVTDDQCTHGPGSLSEGYIEGDVVECNFHNGQFNIKTGEVVSPPCMIPIKTYRTVVENGRVLISVDQ
jgi:nitrite reductase/ring-hydroxylating ferredoxin subunit